VAIPVKELEGINDLISQAEDHDVDLIELRLDYLKDVDIEAIKDIINSCEIPLILTLRKKSEGGFFEGEEEERIGLIKNLIELKPKYVDLEHDCSNLDELIKLARTNKVQSIVSYHDFKKTPNLDESKKIVQGLTESNANIVKFITMANSFQDNLIPINLINENKGLNMVSFCMGKDGEFSRVFSILFGGFFTFASIEEKTAPGQIPIEEMQDLLSRYRGGENW